MGKRILVYGSKECSRCVDAKAALNQAGIEYDYVDVLSSLDALKQYINIRDTNPEVFAEPIQKGKIGLPVFVIDGKVYHGAIQEFDFELFSGGGCDVC